MAISVNRRQFLSALSFASIPSAIAVKSESDRQIPANFGKPEFWFGDVIRYPWFNADENKIHWETGEIMGVNWHPEEKRWLYTVNWTGSTFDRTGFTYPNFDECLTDCDDFKLVV